MAWIMPKSSRHATATTNRFGVTLPPSKGSCYSLNI
jgi:hypothetical protein